MRTRLVWWVLGLVVHAGLVHLMATILVVGSYVLAEQLKVRRPKRRGATVARRPDAPPVSAT